MFFSEYIEEIKQTLDQTYTPLGAYVDNDVDLGLVVGFPHGYQGSIIYHIPMDYLHVAMKMDKFIDPIAGTVMPELTRAILPELDAEQTRFAFCGYHSVQRIEWFARGFAQMVLHVHLCVPEKAHLMLLSAPEREIISTKELRTSPYVRYLGDKQTYLEDSPWHVVSCRPVEFPEGQRLPFDYELSDNEGQPHICKDVWLLPIEYLAEGAAAQADTKKRTEKRRELAKMYWH